MTENIAPQPNKLIIPRLYTPEPMRIDDCLSDEVNELMMEWVDETGLFPDQHDKLRATNFGRFAVLSHPDTEDIDRLLFVAQYTMTLLAVDEYYCEDINVGALPSFTAHRLLTAFSAVEPACLTGKNASALEQRLNLDPITVGLRSCMKRAAALATPYQIARIRYEIAALFMAWNPEASRRVNDARPEVWTTPAE